MQYSLETHTGGRPIRFSVSVESGPNVDAEVIPQPGLSFQTTSVHLGLKGELPDIVGDPLAYYILSKT